MHRSLSLPVGPQSIGNCWLQLLTGAKSVVPSPSISIWTDPQRLSYLHSHKTLQSAGIAIRTVGLGAAPGKTHNRGVAGDGGFQAAVLFSIGFSQVGTRGPSRIVPLFLVCRSD